MSYVSRIALIAVLVAAQSAPSRAAEVALEKPLPYRLDQDYRYTWSRKRQKTGETRFTLESVRSGEGGDVIGYRLFVNFRHEKEGTTLRMRREYRFNSHWKFEHCRSQLTFQTIKEIGSAHVSESRRVGERLITEATPNRQESQKSVSEVLLPPGAFILPSQAIESWALFAALFRGRLEQRTYPVVYPDFERTYQVNFHSQGDVEWKRADASVRCRRLRFQSRDRQLSGELWIDDRGRLLRYTQGDLQIDLELHAGKKKPASKPAAESSQKKSPQTRSG